MLRHEHAEIDEEATVAIFGQARERTRLRDRVTGALERFEQRVREPLAQLVEWNEAGRWPGAAGVRVAVVDCLSGGAQEQFESLCRDLERAGWELGKRYFDNRHLRRGGSRWEISIGRYDPYEDVSKQGWYRMGGSK